jgi:hypothetical protein
MTRLVKLDSIGMREDREGMLGAIETGNLSQALVSTVNTKRPVCF